MRDERRYGKGGNILVPRRWIVKWEASWTMVVVVPPMGRERERKVAAKELGILVREL